MGQLRLVDCCPEDAPLRAVYMCRSHDGASYMKFEVGQDSPGPTDIIVTSCPAVFRAMMQKFCPHGASIRVTRNGITHSYNFGV